MSRNRHYIAWAVKIAVLLLVGSCAVITNHDISALQNVTIPVTVQPITPDPVTRTPASTLLPTSITRTGEAAAPVPTSAPAAVAVATVTPIQLIMPPGGGLALPRASPVQAQAPACPNRITGSDLLLFSAANGHLVDTNSHAFTYDFDITAQSGTESAGFDLMGSGFNATQADGSSIDFQVDSTGAFVIGEERLEFTYDLRTDSNDFYLRFSVPSRAFSSPMFVISLIDALANSTQGVIGGGADEFSLDIEQMLNLGALEDNPQFFELFDFGEFVCTVRQANISNGQALFTSTIDVLAFLGSPAFGGVIDALLMLAPNAAGELGLPANTPGMGAMVAPMVAQLVSSVVPNLSIEINQVMNINDQQVERTTLDIRATISSDLSGGAPALIRMSIQGTVNYSGYGAAYMLDRAADAVRVRNFDEISAYIEQMLTP